MSSLPLRLKRNVAWALSADDGTIMVVPPRSPAPTPPVDVITLCEGYYDGGISPFNMSFFLFSDNNNNGTTTPNDSGDDRQKMIGTLCQNCDAVYDFASDNFSCLNNMDPRNVINAFCLLPQGAGFGIQVTELWVLSGLCLFTTAISVAGLAYCYLVLKSRAVHRLLMFACCVASALIRCVFFLVTATWIHKSMNSCDGRVMMSASRFAVRWLVPSQIFADAFYGSVDMLVTYFWISLLRPRPWLLTLCKVVGVLNWVLVPIALALDTSVGWMKQVYHPALLREVDDFLIQDKTTTTANFFPYSFGVMMCTLSVAGVWHLVSASRVFYEFKFGAYKGTASARPIVWRVTIVGGLSAICAIIRGACLLPRLLPASDSGNAGVAKGGAFGFGNPKFSYVYYIVFANVPLVALVLCFVKVSSLKVTQQLASYLRLAQGLLSGGRGGGGQPSGGDGGSGETRAIAVDSDVLPSSRGTPHRHHSMNVANGDAHGGWSTFVPPPPAAVGAAAATAPEASSSCDTSLLDANA